MKGTSIRVVIVDDSLTARVAIRAVLEREGTGVTVVGEAANGRGALQAVRELRPDLVTMDVHLPQDDGIAVTTRIMAEAPTPVLIVTSLDSRDAKLIYRAMQAGAVDVIGKPPPPRNPGYAESSQRLIKLVRALAHVPVVRRGFRPSSGPRSSPDVQESPPSPPVPVPCEPADADREPRWAAGARCALIAVGASTGGPIVVRQLLAALPQHLPVPVGIVQHIMPGFAEGFATWLEQETRQCVRVVKRRVPLEPGVVYIANDTTHLELIASDALDSVDGPALENQRPSVDRFFQSAAKFIGPSVIAVLLTGMGRDGARGLLSLRDAGALTIAQAPDTCAVGGMPSAAIGMGAARLVYPPDGIAAEIKALLRLDAR